MYNNFIPYYYLPYRQQPPPIQIDPPMTEYEGAIGAGASGPEGSVYQPPGTMPTGPYKDLCKDLLLLSLGLLGMEAFTRMMIMMTRLLMSLYQLEVYSFRHLGMVGVVVDQ
ncbi:hypothetical protein [Peribacillus simplex]|uniref:hypothetical protein n=1 Tax=Peribacillus simplex TaxID=1478 RepID=UPI003D269E6E